MRKLISLVVVLFFLGMVAQAQEDTSPVLLSVTIQEGVFVEVLPTSLTWTLSVDKVDGFIPPDGEELLSYRVSWKIPSGHVAHFFQRSETDLVYVDMTTEPIENHVQQTFIGGQFGGFTGMVAPKGTEVEIGHYGGVTAGVDIGEIELMFDNKVGLKAGIMTATILYKISEN